MYVSFALYDSAGSPLTTATPTFASYKDIAGTNSAAPPITNLGSGLYGFEIVYADAIAGRAFEIDNGSGAFPARIAGGEGPIWAFGLYDAAGAPLASATPTFTSYRDVAGAVASPSIVNLGSGLYGFVPTVANKAAYVSFVINCGASSNPSYVSGQLEPDGESVPPVPPDVTPPTIIIVRSLNARSLEVIFSEAVQESTALNSNNYSINNGLTVSAVEKVSPSVYRLTTSKQTTGVAYTVTINNVKDIAGNTI